MTSLTELREAVHRANLALVEAGLVTLSFGNASGVDRSAGVLVIKPSGVPYDRLRPEDMVAVSLDTEEVVEGDLRPSSDTPTHAALYRLFPDIGGVVHTHSPFATAWAQAAAIHPLPGDDPRGPLRRLRAGHAGADRGGGRGRVRARDRSGHRRDASRPRARSAAHARSAGRLARSIHLGSRSGRGGDERDRVGGRRGHGAPNAPPRANRHVHRRGVAAPALRPQARAGRLLRSARRSGAARS